MVYSHEHELSTATNTNHADLGTSSFTVLLYLCFILSLLRRLDYSAVIQELFSFLGIGTKQIVVHIFGELLELSTVIVKIY